MDIIFKDEQVIPLYICIASLDDFLLHLLMSASVKERPSKEIWYNYLGAILPPHCS